MAYLENDIMALRTFPMQKVQNFECILPEVGSGNAINVSRLVQSVNYNDGNMLEPNSMNYGDHQAYFSSLLKQGEFSFTFIETEYQDVKNYIIAWRKLIVDSNGLFRVKLVNYAQTITLNYLSNSGDVTNTVYFLNAFPLGYQNLELSYASSGVQRMSVRFICDRVAQEEVPLQ